MASAFEVEPLSRSFLVAYKTIATDGHYGGTAPLDIANSTRERNNDAFRRPAVRHRKAAP
jgi:hypothetical protein